MDRALRYSRIGLIGRRGIDVDSNTRYEFSAILWAVTFEGTREVEFEVDLRLGSNFESGASLQDWPRTIVGRGDHNEYSRQHRRFPRRPSDNDPI